MVEPHQHRLRHAVMDGVPHDERITRILRRLHLPRTYPAPYGQYHQHPTYYPRQILHSSCHPLSTSSITASLPFSTLDIAAASAHIVSRSSTSGTHVSGTCIS